MRPIHCIIKSVAVALCVLASGMTYAQSRTARFAHIPLPEEPDCMAPDGDKPLLASKTKIWTIDPAKWTLTQAVDASNRGWDNYIQGVAARGSDAFFYISGEGIYRLRPAGAPELVRPREEKWLKNYSEAYKAMNIDPTGSFLLLYGQNENAAVFDIAAGMKPVAAFNDHVMDAYWLADCLWAGCINKVVINSRKGRSKNNEDFIFTGDNDQHGMIKFYVSDKTVLPNMGEQDVVINERGEITRLLYNKGNGDVLLCVSDFSGSTGSSAVYKIEGMRATPVARFNGFYGDFAAYGDKIIARTGRGFIEVSYGDNLTDAEAKPIQTDILRPKLWAGDKPEPYKITGSHLMDFDSHGNLWIVLGRDLFVRFKQPL